MKIKPIQAKEMKQKVVFLTGGLNEEVSSLQLQGGELTTCLNYHEMAGQYSGYASVRGFERVDGRVKPSEISITTTIDRGLDGDVTLLAEGDSGFADLTNYDYTITNTGVGISTARYKNGLTSFRFPAAATATIEHRSTLSLAGDFCIEFYYFCTDITRVGQVILEKAGEYGVTLEGSLLRFHCNTTEGPITLDSPPLLNLQWQHVVIQNLGGSLRINVDNVAGDDLPLEGAIIPTTGDLAFGSPSNTGTFNLDQVRFSSVVRYPGAPNPPEELFSTNDYYVELVDDTAREGQRELTTALPGSGTVCGVAYYKGDIYGWRNDLGVIPTRCVMYKGTPSDGWEEVIQPEGYDFNPSGTIHTTQYRFESFSNNESVLVITDGVSPPRVFDGTTVTVITSNQIPDNQATPTNFASICGAYDNRLFLGYDAGSIIFSDIGDPTSFSAIIGSAGELFLGSPVTNIIEAPGNILVVTCQSFIKLIKSVGYDGTLWSFQVETHSRSRGSIRGTAQSALGTIYFADHDGIISLVSSDTYGSMASSLITNKVQSTYLANRESIIGALVNEELNQYQIYFRTGEALVLTFDLEKKVKGAARIAYGTTFLHLAEGQSDVSGDILRFASAPTGYIYQLDSGTSFDGEVIKTQMVSAYYHYKSPRLWKQFKRITLEGTGPRGVRLHIRTLFDYGETQVPQMSATEYTTKSSGSRYGEGQWGSMIWGASAANRVVAYLPGYGTNMGLEVRSESKYKEPHVLHNFITDFNLGPKQS